MPKKPDELRAQIKALEAHLKEQKAERRAAEAPLRAARRVITDRLRLLKLRLTKAEASRAQMLSPFWITSEDSARSVYGERWTNNAASIERFKAESASAELNLELFNTQHPELT